MTVGAFRLTETGPQTGARATFNAVWVLVCDRHPLSLCSCTLIGAVKRDRALIGLLDASPLGAAEVSLSSPKDRPAVLFTARME